MRNKSLPHLLSWWSEGRSFSWVWCIPNHLPKKRPLSTWLGSLMILLALPLYVCLYKYLLGREEHHLLSLCRDLWSCLALSCFREDTWNFLMRLRWYSHCLESVSCVQVRPSMMWTPRLLKLLILRGCCTSIIISLVLLTFRRSCCLDQQVRVSTSSG